MFVHDGEIEIEISGALQRIGTGQGVLIFPDTPFFGESISDRTLASVHHFVFAKKNVGGQTALDGFRGRRQGFRFLDADRDRRINRDLERSIRLGGSFSDVLNRESQSCLLRLVLLQLQVERRPVSSSSARKTQIKLHQLVSWLSENITESIAVEEMAAKISISESHLRRVFRAEYGTGPAHYFQEMRMREARRLLRESVEPIKAISNRLGYNDLPHFYRSFKAHTKSPPAEYRDRNCPIG